MNRGSGPHRNSHGRGRRHRGSFGDGNEISSAEDGNSITLKLPPGLVDVFKQMVMPPQENRAKNNRGCGSRWRGFEDLPEWKKAKIRAYRRKMEGQGQGKGRQSKWKNQREKNSSEDFKESFNNQHREHNKQRDNNKKSGFEKRLQAAIENNEGVPEWILKLLPPVKLESEDLEENKRKEKNDDDDVEESQNRFGNDDEIPFFLKGNQGMPQTKEEIRQARLKKFNSRKCGKQNKRRSHGRRQQKGKCQGRSRVTEREDGKLVRITNQKKVTKRFGPLEIDIIQTDKEILTPKEKEVPAEEEEPSTDQSIVQLLGKLDEEEKVQLLQLLMKLLNKN